MSAIRRRSLQIDDPLASGAARDPEHASPSALGGTAAVEGRLRDIPLEQVRANPDQPRRRFEEASLASLAESIRERGVLQPVIVRPVLHGYELVAGERRWRAAGLAREATVPALVDHALDEAGSLELALIENVVREDLTPIEQARTLATLLDALRLTSSVLAKRLGRSRSDLANFIRLLEPPDEAIKLIDAGVFFKGHGKVLLTEADHDRGRLLARRSAERGWSVRALEAQVARLPRPTKPRKIPQADQFAASAELEDAIAKATGCQVQARPHRHGFRIILDHVAAERLARLLVGDIHAP